MTESKNSHSPQLTLAESLNLPCHILLKKMILPPFSALFTLQRLISFRAKLPLLPLSSQEEIQIARTAPTMFVFCQLF
jgi:hypothetical protein